MSIRFKLLHLVLTAFILVSCKNNETKKVSNLDYIQLENLEEVLRTVWLDEQLPIRERDSLMDIYGPEHEILLPLEKKIDANHDVNMQKVNYIIETFGWPSPEQSGTDGNWTICNVIQHDTPETRESYVPIMKQAVLDGKLEPRFLVRTQDRVATDKGELQIYGGQMKYYKETQSFNVWPVYDPVNINKRRAEIGLNTIEEHLKDRFDFEWDLEEQIKRTEAFEKERLKKTAQ